MPSSITFMNKIKFPANVVKIMVSVMALLKIFCEILKKTKCVICSCNVTNQLMLWNENQQGAVLYLPGIVFCHAFNCLQLNHILTFSLKISSLPSSKVYRGST